MELYEIYAEGLKKLKENEDYIETFRLMIFKDRNDKETIDFLMKFSVENNLSKVRGWVYYYLGWYHFDKSAYEKAAESFLITNDIFQDFNYKHGLIYAANGLTNVYCRLGQFNLSNEWSLRGISLCEEENNKIALNVLLINTSINYIEMKDYKTAEEILYSVETTEKELTGDQKASLNLALADIEIHIGDPSLAFVYIEIADKIKKETKEIPQMSEVHKLKGMAYVKLGMYDSAEDEFKKAYDYAVKYNLIYEKSEIVLHMSNLSILTGKKRSAVKWLLEAIDDCKEKNIKILLKEAYYILYTIYKDYNRPYDALEYLEKYKFIDDEMYDYEQNQLMAKLNFKHKKREADRYKQLYDKTRLLSSIGQKIISNLYINSVITILNEEINKLMNTDYFGLAVYDGSIEQVTYYFAGEDAYFQNTVYVDGGGSSSFGSYCIKNKKDIIIQNVDKEYKKYIEKLPSDIKGAEGKPKMLSLIYTPLIINDKVVGLMSVQSEKENVYSKNDLYTLKILANYAAIAIENALSYKKVEEKSIYDSLTKFLTKFEILRLGEIVFKKHKVNKLKLSVAMIDLDNFKKVNDTFGHYYGDKALGMVAETISKCIRNTDYIGRYGGDEFLLICPGLGKHEAVEVAERIRKTIECKIFDLGDGIFATVTLSIGVHEFTELDNTFFDMLKRADKCLYSAKGERRNLVICN